MMSTPEPANALIPDAVTGLPELVAKRQPLPTFPTTTANTMSGILPDGRTDPESSESSGILLKGMNPDSSGILLKGSGSMRERSAPLVGPPVIFSPPPGLPVPPMPDRTWNSSLLPERKEIGKQGNSGSAGVEQPAIPFGSAAVAPRPDDLIDLAENKAAQINVAEGVKTENKAATTNQPAATVNLLNLEFFSAEGRSQTEASLAAAELTAANLAAHEQASQGVKAPPPSEITASKVDARKEGEGDESDHSSWSSNEWKHQKERRRRKTDKKHNDDLRAQQALALPEVTIVCR